MGHLLNKKNIHTGFHIGLILKGIFDIGEIISGVMMFYLTPERMAKLFAVISKEELLEDPNDFVMNYIVSYSQLFTMSTQHFTSYYLLSHGAVKILVLILLWKKKIWAYPVSCILFLTFIALQVERFFQTHSIMLLVLTILDVIMLSLTILEYRNISHARRML